jgi:hypothetical protein
MKNHDVNKDNHFIMIFDPEEGDDLSILDSIVEYHNSDKVPKVVGKSWTGTKETSKAEVVKDVKDSIDSNLSDYPLEIRNSYYVGFLQPLVDRYKQKYNELDRISKWGIREEANVQWYPKNGGFKRWHAEKGSLNETTNLRVLVYMTYLNDIEDGGQTEFMYQNLAIQPKKGRTVIWTPEWTHTHRGVPSPTQEKMIITGWYSYV